MAKQVPVYLFTGFLESGKTKFAQQTLEDASFNNGDRILLLVCEEGVEEYDPSAFAAPTVFTETIESESDLTTENLAALLKPDARKASQRMAEALYRLFAPKCGALTV